MHTSTTLMLLTINAALITSKYLLMIQRIRLRCLILIYIIRRQFSKRVNFLKSLVGYNTNTHTYNIHK